MSLLLTILVASSIAQSRNPSVDELLKQPPNQVAFEQLMQMMESGTIEQKVQIITAIPDLGGRYEAYWRDCERLFYVYLDKKKILPHIEARQTLQERLTKSVFNAAINKNSLLSAAALQALFSQTYGFDMEPQKIETDGCGVGYSATLSAEYEERLRELGKERPDKLMQFLHGQDAQLAFKACRCLPEKEGLKGTLITKWLESSNPEFRCAALNLLTGYAQEDIEKTARLLNDPDLRVATTVAGISEHLDEVIRLSGTPYLKLPKEVRSVLLTYHLYRPESAQTWSDAVSDPDPFLRYLARRQAFGQNYEPTTEELVYGARFGEPEYVEDFLSELAKRNYAGLSQLKEDLQSQGRVCWKTLERLGKEKNPSYLSTLCALAGRTYQRLDDWPNIDQQVKPFIDRDQLKQLTFDKNLNVRRFCLEIFGIIFGRDEKSRSDQQVLDWVWMRQMQDPDPSIRSMGVQQLNLAIPTRREYFFSHLADFDTETIREGVARLFGLGKSQMPALKTFADSRNPQIHEFATLAISILEDIAKNPPAGWQGIIASTLS